MATCLELWGLLRALAGLLDGLTLPITAMAEWGLLGRPPELGRPPPDPGRAGLPTPGFSRGVLAAPSALSNLPGTQQLLSFVCVAVHAVLMSTQFSCD